MEDGWGELQGALQSGIFSAKYVYPQAHASHSSMLLQDPSYKVFRTMQEYLESTVTRPWADCTNLPALSFP